MSLKYGFKYLSTFISRKILNPSYSQAYSSLFPLGEMETSSTPVPLQCPFPPSCEGHVELPSLCPAGCTRTCISYNKLPLSLSLCLTLPAALSLCTEVLFSSLLNTFFFLIHFYRPLKSSLFFLNFMAGHTR